MMPFNKVSDKPNSPFEDFETPFVPMNEGAGMDLTVASLKSSFPLTEEDFVQKSKTPPGGTSLSWNGTGDKMQYNKEGNQSYSGAAVKGRVLEPSGDIKLNKMYD